MVLTIGGGTDPLQATEVSSRSKAPPERGEELLWRRGWAF